MLLQGAIVYTLRSAHVASVLLQDTPGSLVASLAACEAVAEKVLTLTSPGQGLLACYPTYVAQT